MGICLLNCQSKTTNGGWGMKRAAKEKEGFRSLNQMRDNILAILKKSGESIEEKSLIRQVYVLTNEIVPYTLLQKLKRDGLIASSGRCWIFITK